MALSDILKKYGDTTATEGIMIPTAGVKSISTEQEVYDAATDGIMTVNQEKYIGPTSTIVYGNEDDSYTRMLREIEQGELPQFDQSTFPAVGTGIMQPSTPVTQPVDTTPVQPDEPKFDPCPPGFKLINGVCQPVEQDRGRDRPPPQGPKIVNGIIEGFEDLDLQGVDVRTGDFYNRLSPEMKAEYDRALKYGRGLQVKFGPDGEPVRIVAKSPNILQALAEMNVIAGVLNAFASKEKVTDKEVEDTSDKIINLIDQEATPRDFGTLFGVDDFGQLQRNIDTANLEISAATEALQQIANSTKYREQRTDKQIDDDIRTQQRKIEKARQTIEESNDMMQGTSAKEDRERAAIMARDINRERKSAEQRIKESEDRRKAEAAKPIEQRQSEKEERSANFRKLSRDIASFRDKFRR